ncbi:MAG: hypothetical protein K0U54_09975 [Bacteroidetes bacterium]|nr:hypothetical protein [Bacteroidota bacterium]
MIVRLYLLLLYALCACTLVAQELPPVVNFTPEAYGADNQNWMVSQAKEGTIYVANNAGLLEFNGAKWTLYPSPNETIIRSVNVINDTIYTGAYMDFGFWTKTKQSDLVYTSLNQQKNIDIIEDEQFWNIIHHQKWLFFQSLDRILILNKATGNISSIEADHTISKIYKLNNEIYFQVVSEGIFSIRNGKKELVSDHELAKTNRFIAAFIIDDALTFISEKNGFFKLNGKEILPWKTASDFALQSIAIYSGIQMEDASILLGTITHGVYHISKTGKILYNLDQTNGLDNNTALTLFEDQRKNIWVGLDNGLDCINTSAPLQNYVDHTGRLGTTYASQSFGGNLYLGTNQGLFYRPLDQSVDFILIEGTEGPVWNLKVIDDTLFCGHNLGTFIVEEGKAQLVATIQGTWDIKKIPTQPNLLLQGNYTGLYTLSKESGAWKIKSKLKGFDISCKHFEITDDLTIFVSHEYKGVFQLQANEAFDKIENYHTVKSLSKGIHSSLVAFNNRIFYANKKGIFEYDPVKKSFANVEELSEIFNGNEFSSGKLVVSNDILWAFTKSHIWQIEVEKIDNSYRTKKLSIPQILREEMEGYENLSYLDESNLYEFSRPESQKN